MKHKADIGIFGGSGFYQFLDNVEMIKVETPYGAPSDKIALAEIEGRKVAFLPRHGHDHSIPPHMINYRANIYAMKKLGVQSIIGPCAAGSLKKEVVPGHFVVCDQYVDRTKGRIDTFYDGPITTHVSPAEPYCPALREMVYNAGKEMGLTIHKTGTMVVIQGPRFSTKAESRWFSQAGWSVINMTGYPEAYLAREMEMCYVNISLITDYDAGLEGEEVAAVNHEMVIKIFHENNEKLKNLLLKMIKAPAPQIKCTCREALKNARIE